MLSLRGWKIVRPDVVSAGLEDRKTDGLYVVDSVKGIQCSQGVAHHLRVFCGIHQDTKTVFEIDDMQYIICHDHAVTGSEAFRYPL